MARRKAFTLLEGLTASVVLVILVVGVVGSLSTSYQQSQAVRATSTAVTLARQLVDEIVSKPFDSGPLGPVGAPRSTYADVNAYNSYSDNSNVLPLLEGGSLNVTGEDNYARRTTVVVGAQPNINGVADNVSPATDFAIVTVNVTCPDGQIISIPEFVAKYAIPRQ
jgi:type II secretory pathway pseudopilin PulG